MVTTGIPAIYGGDRGSKAVRKTDEKGNYVVNPNTGQQIWTTSREQTQRMNPSTGGATTTVTTAIFGIHCSCSGCIH